MTWGDGELSDAAITVTVTLALIGMGSAFCTGIIACSGDGACDGCITVLKRIGKSGGNCVGVCMASCVTDVKIACSTC